MKKKAILNLFTFLLEFLFAYTAASKLANFSFFKAQLILYPILQRVVPLVAYGVPSAELILCAMLLFPSTRRFGFIGSFWILCLFTTYLIVMVISQNHLPCSCGGVIGVMSWKQHILFN